MSTVTDLSNSDRSTTDANHSVLSHNQKYRGLLKRSPLKDFRDELFKFFDYIYKLSPSFSMISDVMRYLHFIQILMLAFYPYSTILWPQKSLLSQIFKVLSVIGMITPVRTNVNIHAIFELIFIILLFIIIIYFFYCLRVFLFYTNLNSFSIKLFTILLNSFLPYMITIASSNLGLNLFLIIAYEKTDSNFDPYYGSSEPYIGIVIFNFICGLMLLILMIFLQIFFATPSLTLRPQAIHILTSSSSLLYFVFVAIFGFSSTFGSIYGGILGLFFMLLPVLPITLLLNELYDHFEVLTTAKFHQALTSLISVNLLMILVIPILSLFEMSINEIVVFIFLLILGVWYHFIFPFYLNMVLSRNKSLLDSFETIDYKKIPKNIYLQLIRMGFDNGYAICHNWSIFKMKELYTDKTFLGILARYAAIYPDESDVLKFACTLMRKAKHNSLEMKYLLYQSQNLIQQRQTEYSKWIKKATSKIIDKTKKCRNQLRVIWESVISGATSELESLTTQLKKDEDEITREYSQLCWLYPNNYYVVSNYSAFLSEIMCKAREAAEYAQIYRQLKSGTKTQRERSYYYAMKQIEKLPTESQHTLLAHPEKKSERKDHFSNRTSALIGSAFGASFGETPEEIDRKTQHRYIEAMIDSITLPSLRYGPFILFLTVSLLFPILSIVLIITLYNHLTNNLNGVKLMEKFSLLTTYICQISLTSFYYALAKNFYVNELYTFFNISYDEKGRPLVSDERLFLQGVNESLSLLNDINDFFPNLAGTGFFGEPLRYLNSPSIEFQVYSSTLNSSQSLWSFQHICSFIGLIAVEMTNKKNYKLFGFPEFRTVVFNSFDLLNQSKIMLDTLIDSHDSMMNDFFNAYVVFVFAIGFSCLVIVTIVNLHLFFQLNKEKNMLFNSFKLLPKSSISSIVEKLDEQTGRGTTENIASLTLPEKNAIKTMNISTDRFHRNTTWIFIAICIIIAYLAVICTMLSCVFSLKENLTSRFPQMSSLMLDLTRIHRTFYIILLTEMRIASMNNEDLNSILGENVSQLLDECNYLLRTQLTNLYYLRFGGTDIQSKGLSSIGIDMISLLTKTNEINYELPNGIDDVLSQCSLDNKIMYTYELLDGIYKDLEFKSKSGEANNLIQINDTRFVVVLQFLLKDGNNIFVNQGIKIIDKKITDLNNDIKYKQILTVLVVMDVIIIICGILVMNEFKGIGERAQWALRLLFFCPAKVVIQSHSISKLLSNGFTKDDTNESDESTQFYNDVIAHYKDPVIFMDNELRIHGANKSFLSLFKKSFNDVEKRKIDEVFTLDYERQYQNDVQDDDDSEANAKNEINARFQVSIRNFLNEISKIEKSVVPPSFNGTIEMVIDKEFFSFNVSLIAINKEGEIADQVVQIESLSLFSLIMVNQTVSAKLQQEYEKEKNTIRKLLSVFIPLPLVDEYIETRKNTEQPKPDINQSLLAFNDFTNLSLSSEPAPFSQIMPNNSICKSVQSVSIVMIDIVGFTVWATKKKNDAIKIMQRLDKIYSEFEKILKNYSELVKISSMGDTFMAAGGILSDVNQPQVHAKQAVSFGIDAISHLDLINVQHNSALKIRVGVNNGGPVVAGVLNLQQPAFVLFGDPVSFTVRIEETGKPMQVHIPQVVYDYIYGENFVIKEGDPFEYKDHTYNTYFVTAYDQQYEP